MRERGDHRTIEFHIHRQFVNDIVYFLENLILFFIMLCHLSYLSIELTEDQMIITTATSAAAAATTMIIIGRKMISINTFVLSFFSSHTFYSQVICLFTSDEGAGEKWTDGEEKKFKTLVTHDAPDDNDRRNKIKRKIIVRRK